MWPAGRHNRAGRQSRWLTPSILRTIPPKSYFSMTPLLKICAARRSFQGACRGATLHPRPRAETLIAPGLSPRGLQKNPAGLSSGGLQKVICEVSDFAETRSKCSAPQKYDLYHFVHLDPSAGNEDENQGECQNGRSTGQSIQSRYKQPCVSSNACYDPPRLTEPFRGVVSGISGGKSSLNGSPIVPKPRLT